MRNHTSVVRIYITALAAPTVSLHAQALSTAFAAAYPGMGSKGFEVGARWVLECAKTVRVLLRHIFYSRFGLVGLVWFGLVRFGSVWFGSVRFGLGWLGLFWFGLAG
jgi:hypothetical protein